MKQNCNKDLMIFHAKANKAAKSKLNINRKAANIPWQGSGRGHLDPYTRHLGKTVSSSSLWNVASASGSCKTTHARACPPNETINQSINQSIDQSLIQQSAARKSNLAFSITIHCKMNKEHTESGICNSESFASINQITRRCSRRSNRHKGIQCTL